MSDTIAKGESPHDGNAEPTTDVNPAYLTWDGADPDEFDFSADTPHAHLEARDLLRGTAELSISRRGRVNVHLEGYAEENEEYHAGATVRFDPEAAEQLATNLLDAAEMARASEGSADE
jgi:hypothetical protein